MQYAVIFALLVFVLIQQIMHLRERKDLYNRLMAKDLTEYTVIEQQKKAEKRKKPVNIKFEEYKKNWKI